jgi:large subunit ribosomal protein L35
MRQRVRVLHDTCHIEEHMPKKKTKKGAAKRMKMSATGKIMYARAGKGHLNSCKSRKQKRNLRGMAVLHEGDVRRYKIMLSS